MCSRATDDRSTITGVYSDEVPPVLIPNTEVKLISAEGTWLDTARESMSMPVSITESTQQCVLFVLSVFCFRKNSFKFTIICFKFTILCRVRAKEKRCIDGIRNAVLS